MKKVSIQFINFYLRRSSVKGGEQKNNTITGPWFNR